MHLLLTNDDGIEAEGLQAFATFVRKQPTVTRVTIVAPIDGRSCCSHTVNTYSPMRLQNVAPEEFTLNGWPADCIRIAIVHLGLRPDWVLSGVNHGGNLGLDIMMSGTCSAAREATWLGFRAIALSQYRSPNIQIPWIKSAARAWSVSQQIMAHPLGDSYFKPPGKLSGFWNVNLPSIDASVELPPLVSCKPDPSPHQFHWDDTPEGLLYRSSYQNRPRLPGHDIQYCFDGSPTVSFCNAWESNIHPLNHES